MDESFAALAVVKRPGGSVGSNARQCGHVEHAAQSAVVAFRSAQITGDSAGIPWHRHQSGVRRQASGSGEGRHIAAGDDEEFGPQARSESGQRLDDVRVGVVAEALGDGLVDVFDLTVEVEQLAGQSLDQGGGAGLPGQRELLLVRPARPRWPRSWRYRRPRPCY